MLDEHGKPKFIAQDTAIKNSFGQAWQVYSKTAGANPDGFRAFLEANAASDPKAAVALGYLNKLRDLLVQIKSLGLTNTEFEVSMKVLLAKATGEHQGGGFPRGREWSDEPDERQDGGVGRSQATVTGAMAERINAGMEPEVSC